MGKDLYISALLDVYGMFLGEKQRRVTEYYYDDDLSLAEIAENEGITRQGVRDNIKRAEAKLFELEDKCRYCESFLKLKRLADEQRSGKNNIDKILDIIDDL